VTTTGISDVPSLPLGTSENYTSKVKSTWTVNISAPEVLDTFVYAIALPPGAIVNYVSGKNARITTDGDSIVVRGAGSDLPLSVAVQYSLGEPQRNYSWLQFGIGVLLAILLAGMLRMLQRRTAKPHVQSKPVVDLEDKGVPTYIEGLPKRQQVIIELLRKAGGTLTQRQVELALKLPKSSVSRNVESLRRRGIISKAQTGMSNTLVLEENQRY